MDGSTHFADYHQQYDHISMHRTDGILEVRLQAPDGTSMIWGALPHAELSRCFNDVARDRANRVVILTGTGDSFITRVDDSWAGGMTAEKWFAIYFNGSRLLDELLGIEVPVIGAVNGPALVHAEIALLSDITLASDTATFQDRTHFRRDSVPGDGVQHIWLDLLGTNRGRYFLLTGQKLTPREAFELGVINEVVPAGDLLERARELARDLCKRSDVTLRYTRLSLTNALRTRLREQVRYGLALEGLGAHETWL